MNVFSLQMMVILAGVINGAFALPTRYIKHWQFENSWLTFAVLAFIIFPIGTVLLSHTALWTLYSHAAHPLIIAMILGGLAFGIGQFCFAIALNSIGFGLGFLINIGLGTALGFSLPLVVLHPQELLTAFGLTTLLGTVLILIGLLLAYWAGHSRDQHKQTEPSKIAGFGLGVVLATVAGIFSAIQNFTFAFTAPLQQAAIKMGFDKLSAATVVWPGFLCIAFIPYAIYMITLLIRNQSFKKFAQSNSGFNLGCALIMALFWYGSLMLYSFVSINIGALGPVIAWPLFMVMIILTSNVIGWRQGEWSGAPTKSIKKLMLGIVFLILAFLVLAYSIKLPH